MKKRLDVLLTEKGLSPSREKARVSVMEGIVYVNGQKEDKPGSQFDEDSAVLEIRGETLRYVSRGGKKLEKALEVFPISLAGRCCIDIGASTGGFTDCMLQNGAKEVVSVDSGRGQLDYRLRTDPRVICMEKTNFRYLKWETIEEERKKHYSRTDAFFSNSGEDSVPGFDPAERPVFGAADVSFISLSRILPPAFDILADRGQMAVLVKPQFEAGREKVGKKGVVRDPAVHAEVIDNVAGYAAEAGFAVLGLDYSPIRGPEGNIEYLMFLEKDPENAAARTAAFFGSRGRERVIRELVSLSHSAFELREAD